MLHVRQAGTASATVARYCCVCTGEYGIRLCNDGLYYCPECREACEVTVVKRDEP